jgi:hypothetical protein
MELDLIKPFLDETSRNLSGGEKKLKLYLIFLTPNSFYWMNLSTDCPLK